jgi:DNA-binding NarL/FixJ family response regulator
MASENDKQQLPEPWRVLVADTDPDVRAALCLLLGREPSIRIVGQAAETSDLLVLAAASQPDLVVLDWELTQPRAGDLLLQLRATCPSAVCIALSMHPERSGDALSRGILSLVSKRDSPVHLLAMVRSVIAAPPPRSPHP